MGHPDSGLDPEKSKHADDLSDDEVHQALVDRGYTTVDFERMEMRANRFLEEVRIRGVMSRFKLDFSHLASPKK